MHEVPKAVIAGDLVYLYCSAAGDLHMLDMESMALTLVHIPYKPGMLFRAVVSVKQAVEKRTSKLLLYSGGQFIARPQTFVELQLRFKLHFPSVKMQFET